MADKFVVILQVNAECYIVSLIWPLQTEIEVKWGIVSPERSEKHGKPDVSILDSTLLAGLVQMAKVGELIHAWSWKGDINL